MVICFHLRVDVGVGAHRARDLAHRHLLCRPAAAAPDRARTSKAHSPSTMPKVMGSACTPWVRPIMTVSRCSSARRCRMRPSLLVSSSSSAPGRPQLQRQPGVEHVGRREPVVDVLGALPHVLGHAAHEGDDVVLGGLLDLVHPVDVEGGLRLDLLDGLLGDLPQPGPGLADGQLDLQPGGHAGLVGPDGRHLGRGVAFDHRAPPSAPSGRRAGLGAGAGQTGHAQDLRGQDGRVAGPVDGHRGHRDARRHLHHGEERVESTQVGGADGHPDHRQIGHGRHHPRQRGGLAGAGDDDLEAAGLRTQRVLAHRLRVAMGRKHVDLIGDAAARPVP